MPPGTREASNVSRTGYHDLDGKPGFKLAAQVVDDRWYLYVAHLWDSGLSVLDVTDPADPELLTFLEGPENTITIQVQVADGIMVTSLERPIPNLHRVGAPPDLDGHSETGAYVWDVETDPANPVLLGHWESGGDGTHRNYYAGGDYAYMAATTDEYEGRHLAVVDLSDPTRPETVATWAMPEQDPATADPADETYYFHGPAYVDGDNAYLSYGRKGMITLDVADPTDPTEVGRVSFDDLGSWLGVHSAVPIPGTDIVAVNDEAILESRGDRLNYVFLVDVSDPADPGFDGQTPTGAKVVGILPQPRPSPELPYDSYYDKGGRFGPHNQHHHQDQAAYLEHSDLLFTTYFNAGLRVFDVADPYTPREVGHYVPEDPTERVATKPAEELVTQFEDVLVDARGYVYCTEKNSGLYVLETDLL